MLPQIPGLSSPNQGRHSFSNQEMLKLKRRHILAETETEAGQGQGWGRTGDGEERHRRRYPAPQAPRMTRGQRAFHFLWVVASADGLTISPLMRGRPSLTPKISFSSNGLQCQPPTDSIPKDNKGNDGCVLCCEHTLLARCVTLSPTWQPWAVRGDCPSLEVVAFRSIKPHASSLSRATVAHMS